MYKLAQKQNNAVKSHKNLENFTPTPIFAIHSKNGIGIAWLCNGSTTVFGAVCLGSNPGQATKGKASTKVGAFFMQKIESTKEPSEASTIRRKDKYELARDLDWLSIVEIVKQFATE